MKSGYQLNGMHYIFQSPFFSQCLAVKGIIISSGISSIIQGNIWRLFMIQMIRNYCWDTIQTYDSEVGQRKA